MRILVIHNKEAESQLISRLNACEGMTISISNYQDVLGQINDLEIPLVAFFLLDSAQDRETLGHLIAHLPQMVRFSYSLTPDKELAQLSQDLGFAAHLLDSISIEELDVHLYYLQSILLKRVLSLKPTTVMAQLTELHSSLDKSRIITTAIENLPLLIAFDSLAILLSTADSEQLELVAQIGDVELPEVLKIEAEPIHPLVQVVLGNQAVIWDTQDPKIAALAPHYAQYRSILCAPIYTEAQMFGILEFTSKVKVFNDEDLQLVMGIADTLAVAFANADKFNQVERLGRIDDLTQLYNSRHLYQALETEIKRSKRYKIPVSVIFLDLDGFKQVNDVNGHLCGSATLTEVANLIVGLVRETDIVARYGGDEFVVVLPETPVERAVTIAERIRQQIEMQIFKGGGEHEIYLTASFGVASYPENASTPASLIRCADKAMYIAKECNKNQVILAE